MLGKKTRLQGQGAREEDDVRARRVSGSWSKGSRQGKFGGW